MKIKLNGIGRDKMIFEEFRGAGPAGSPRLGAIGVRRIGLGSRSEESRLVRIPLNFTFLAFSSRDGDAVVGPIDVGAAGVAGAGADGGGDVGIGKIGGVAVGESQICAGVVTRAFHGVTTMGGAQFIGRAGAVEGSFGAVGAGFGKEYEGGWVLDHARFEGEIGIHAGVAFVVHAVVEDDALQQIEIRRNGVGGGAGEDGGGVDEGGWIGGVLPERIFPDVGWKDVIPGVHALAGGGEGGQIGPHGFIFVI